MVFKLYAYELCKKFKRGKKGFILETASMGSRFNLISNWWAIRKRALMKKKR